MAGQHAARRHPVRIAPLPREEWSDAAVRAIAVLPPQMQPSPGEVVNSLSVLARHPGLAEAYLRFARYLRERSTLTDRVRELLILRVAWLRGAQYELLRHARNARRLGLDEDEIARVAVGSEAVGWDEGDALVLRAAEELCRDYRIGDASWQALAERYSVQQLMDIVFTVGAYDMLAMAFNTFGVEPEADLPPFPERGRAEEAR